MNIYKFELSMYKKSIFIWSLFVPMGLMFYMAFYPMMAADTSGFEQIVDNFPTEFLAFFGMTPDLPIFSLSGYYALTFGMTQIPLAIQASNYGFHMLSVEERELTADFLLSKPISRGRILISKFLAALTSLTVTNISVWLSSIAIILLVKGEGTFDFTNVIILLTTIVFFQLTFFGIGMLISVSVKKISSVLSYSMALGFGLYIMSSFGQMLSSDIFGLVTPYSHFGPVYILVSGTYNWSLAIISFLVILISFPLSYFLYNKRNIPSL